MDFFLKPHNRLKIQASLNPFYLRSCATNFENPLKLKRLRIYTQKFLKWVLNNNDLSKILRLSRA